jgi:hypothetical protein
MLRIHPEREIYFLVPVHYEVVLTKHHQVTEHVYGSDCFKQHVTITENVHLTLTSQTIHAMGKLVLRAGLHEASTEEKHTNK